MPSPRPVNPSRSVVLALMLTWDSAIPSVCAMHAIMAAMCGAIRGACAMMVASRLTIRNPCLVQLRRGRTHQQAAVGATQAVVRVGKVAPDVAQPCRAQQGIADGVQQHIPVRMSQQAAVEGNLHPADHQLAPGHERMHVESEARSQSHLNASCRCGSLNLPFENQLGESEVVGIRDLEVGSAAHN